MCSILVQSSQSEDASAQFTEDATYVTFVGTYYQGRRDIVESHRSLLAKYLKAPSSATRSWTSASPALTPRW